MTKIETGIRLNGAVAGQNADGNVTYFTTDLLGSIRTTTNNDGFNTITYTYDAFGSLVEGDLTGETDYGYLGKQFDSQTGLYNYGYRDYAPIVARFTTVDPIRDGTNWFVYCNGDPVNFIDLFGLLANDKKQPLFQINYGVRRAMGIGGSTSVYAGAGIGVSADLFNGKSKAVTTGTIGGGVYTEATAVITAGKIVESVVNTGIAVMNAVIDHSGMSKLIGHFKYVELDGRE